MRVLVSRLVGPNEEQNDHLVRLLYQTTDGNALFVTEALKNLREHAQDAPAHSLTTTIWLEPERYLERLSRGERVQEIVRERIERLPEEAADVLRLAAVVGRDFSLELLEQAAVMDPVAGLDVLLQRQFLLERLDERLEFVHQVVRQVAYDSLNPLARRRLHRRVAAALVALGKAEENPAEAAFHFGQAGAVGRLDFARYSVLAGEMLLRTYSLQQAIDHLDNALQTLDTLPDAPPDLVRRAFRGLGLAYENLLDPDGVTATYSRLRRWALAIGDRELALTVHARLTTLLGIVGQQSESNALMEELMGSQEDRPSPTLVDLLNRRAVIFARDRSQARTPPDAWAPFTPPPPVTADPVADLIGSMGSVYAALPLLIYGWLLQIQGQLAASETCLRAAVTLAEDTGQRSLASLAYHQLAVTVMLQGDSAESHRLNEESKILNHQVHGTAAELAALWPRISSAYQALAAGDLARAEERFLRAAHFLEHRGSFRTHLNSTTIGRGLVSLRRGRLTEAEGLLHDGLADTENQYPYTYVLGLLGLAQIRHAQGKLDESALLLRMALAYAGRRSLIREYAATVQAILALRPPGAPLARLQEEVARLRADSPLLAEDLGAPVAG
ncbi:MAG: hypothetical protein D6790_06700 [Caldilineae bacterium]|nr:MAG: hypothetical protein D6790_06700 [Caldilineae bacterium]